MIGTAVWLDPPSRGVLGDLSYPSAPLDCRKFVPMLHTIKAFTDRYRDGAGDAFAGGSGELTRQAFSVGVLDVQAHARILPSGVYLSVYAADSPLEGVRRRHRHRPQRLMRDTGSVSGQTRCR